MNYEYYGTGQKTIIFLHGWGGSISSFKYFADILSNSFKVLNIDFPGFGQSREPLREYSVRDYANEIHNLILNLNIESYYVVAHSFGGRVALVLNDINSNMEKLVLVDSAGIKPRFSLKKWLKIKKYKIYKKLVKTRLLNPKCLEKFGSNDYKNLSENMRKTFVKVVNEDLSRYAKNINIDTLIVWGKNDKETPPYMAKRLKRYIKNSEIVWINNAGHFSYLDNQMLFLRMIEIMFKERL